MYLSLTGVEKKFADKYLLSLLTPIKGDTGLHKNMLTSKNFILNTQTFIDHFNKEESLYSKG
jgi:hypothetical protein